MAVLWLDVFSTLLQTQMHCLSSSDFQVHLFQYTSVFKMNYWKSLLKSLTNLAGAWIFPLVSALMSLEIFCLFLVELC